MRSFTARFVVFSLTAWAVFQIPPPAFAEAKLESQGGGLQTATFDTFTGTVVVNLPEEIVAGDTFSGTVVAEPEGDNEKKKEKNRSALAGYVFELGEHARGAVGDGLLKLDVPSARDGAAPSTATLILREVKKGKPGPEVGRIEIPVLPTAPEIPDFRLPTITQQNVPLRVAGPFDGDLGSSVLQIGGVDALPLAESPRGAIFRSPAGVSGVAPITLHENGEPVAEGDVRNIGTNLSAPKSRLAAGESTTLTTLVTGLDDLDEEIPLRLRFWPPAIISVQGGYDHVKTIRPEDVAPDGTYSFGVRVTGRAPGGWGASVRLKVPEPEESVVDHYVLVLDGATAGRVENVTGVGAGSSTREPLAFDADLNLSDSFYEWMRANFEGPQRRDGRIMGVDAAGRGVESTDFRQAYIESVRFPTLDGRDKSPAYMTVTVNAAVKDFQKTKSLGVDGVVGPKTENWLCSNFRLELGDLPAERVAKIDSFTWKQTVTKDEVGSFREPMREPAGDEFPELKVTITGADESSWARWHRAFYIIDRSIPRAAEPEKKPDARIVFLGPDTQEELGGLAFYDTTYSSLEIHGADSSAGETRKVSIELVGSRLRLDQ